MNYGKLTAGTTKTAIDTAKLSEKGEIITYLSRMGDVLYDVQKGSKLVVALVGTIHTTVDCNEADIVLRKCNLGVHSYFQIVTPDPTHVFGYDDTNLAFVHKSHHALPIRSLKVRAGVPVIHKILDVPKAFFLSKLRQKCPLINDGIAVTLLVIVTGEAAIQCCDFVRLLHNIFLHIRWAVCQYKVAVGHKITHPFAHLPASPLFREVCVSHQSCR
jgi:hypothetical protein